jgi:hypothetical protein
MFTALPKTLMAQTEGGMKTLTFSPDFSPARFERC